MNRTYLNKYSLAFAIAGLLLVATNWTASTTWQRFADMAQHHYATSQLLSCFDELLIILLDAQRAERGYVITGDERFLDPYEQSLKTVESCVRRAKDLSARSDVAPDEITQIEFLVTSKLTELRQIVDIRTRLGADAAMREVKKGEGKLLMDTLRERLDRLKATATATIANYDRRMTTKGGQAMLIIRVSSFLDFIVLSTAVVLLLGELRQRVRTQHELRAANDALELQIAEREGSYLRQRQLEESLAHLNRVATVGEMTSWLAHELNQPLAAISANAQACARGLESGNLSPPEICSAVNDVAAEAIRAGDIVRRLRAFLSGQPALLEQVAVDKILHEAVELCRNEATRRGIELKVLTSKKLPLIHVDQRQLQQVITNLIRNGVDACEGSTTRPGVVTVLAGPLDDNVQISVADNGVGLSEQARAKLFKPYSTTKPRGMGLGLAICHRIVTAQQGRIWVTPNAGGGTVFHVEIPIHWENQSENQTHDNELQRGDRRRRAADLPIAGAAV